jgi:hypothetical protein
MESSIPQIEARTAIKEVASYWWLWVVVGVARVLSPL